MDRIRIVHLITGLATGGAERTLQRLVTGLDRGRFDCSVVSMLGEGEIGPAIRAAGIPVHSLGMTRGTPSPAALFRVVSILRNERPAILQTWLYHADLLGLIATRFVHGPRLIWNIRCSDMDMGQYSLLSRATRRFLATFSRVPDAVIVNSRSGLDVHRRYGYSPRRWELIPNGIDLSLFARDEAGANALRQELGVSPDAPVIGTLGRFDPMKDYATFVRAASLVRERYPELRIIMAGRDMVRENRELMQLLGDAGIDNAAILPGERRDVQRILSAMDVYCLSSAFGEGFPNAVAEAMACEAPAVVTDSGDAAWITGREAVPPGDVRELAGQILAILAMPQSERRRLGMAGRERIREAFGVTRMIAAYESLYTELGTG